MLLCLVGLLAFVAQMSVTTAIREAETTAVMPIDFTRLIWASALGYLWFGEFPDIYGHGLEVASSLSQRCTSPSAKVASERLVLVRGHKNNLSQQAR